MEIRLSISAHFVKKRRNGAVTVEYTVVFPIVIICILILIYLGMLYYQQCLMQAVVSENVQNLAFLWGYTSDEINVKNGIASKDEYASEGIYWHIFTDVEKRKEKVIKTVQNELMLKSIITPQDNFDIEVTYSNLLYCKKVGIRAKAAYPVPFKGFFKLTGSSGYLILDTYSETVVNDPQDFIQNIDYILQLYEESGAKDWMEEKCRPLIGTLQNIKKYFEQKGE